MKTEDLLESMNYFDEAFILEFDDETMKSMRKRTQPNWIVRKRMITRKVIMVAAGLLLLSCFGWGVTMILSQNKSDDYEMQLQDEDQDSYISKGNNQILMNISDFVIENNVITRGGLKGVTPFVKQNQVDIAQSLELAMVYGKQLNSEGGEKKYLVQYIFWENEKEEITDERLYSEYEKILNKGIDAIWVSAGDYVQEDGQVLHFTKNKIYACLSEEQIENTEPEAARGIALELASYKDFSYVNGTYLRDWYGVNWNRE